MVFTLSLIETRIRAIDAQFNDPDVYRDSKKSAALGTERQQLVAELEPLEFEWTQRG